MIRYVLGFAFDQHGRLALIKKAKPDWQAGKWNGVGGKLEAADHSPAHAMSREFSEETGVSIPHDQWRRVARMQRDGQWECEVFTVQHDDVMNVRTTTDEEVRLVTCRWFEKNQHVALENVATLIQVCLLKPGHSGEIPFVTFDYNPYA